MNKNINKVIMKSLHLRNVLNTKIDIDKKEYNKQ